MTAVFWWSVLIAVLSAMTQNWPVFGGSLVVAYVALVCMVGQMLYTLSGEADY